MSKYGKYIISILILLILIAGFTMYKRANKEFIGGFLSSKWTEDEIGYMVSINLDSGYTKDEIEFFANIVSKKRKKELDIFKARNLGNATHEMSVFREDKSTRVTDLVLDADLWLFENAGYIQSKNKKDSIISQLDKEEYEFLLKALLKYHKKEEIFKEEKSE